MTQLKYRDPADGNWKTIGIGGLDEVFIGSASPSSGFELWVDTSDNSSLGLGSWINLPLSTGLQAYSANQTPQYRCNAEYTELRGWISATSGLVNAIAAWPTVAILPPEARTGRDFVTFSSPHANLGTSYANVVRLEHRKSDGALYFSVGGSYPGFAWFSIDGWTFSRMV